jgi:hypothetical protein
VLRTADQGAIGDSADMTQFDAETLAAPAIYHRGKVFFTETTHWFGGDLDLTVKGPPHGPHPLHRILTLDLSDERLGVSGLVDLKYLPLVFGMRFDGFEYDYLVESDHSIDIKRSSQQTSSNDWPYDGFPDVLPRLALRLLDPVRASPEEASNLTLQGFSLTEPEEMVTIVPSQEEYGGVSLWGEYGRGVQLIFYFTHSVRRVSADNQVD